MKINAKHYKLELLSTETEKANHVQSVMKDIEEMKSPILSRVYKRVIRSKNSDSVKTYRITHRPSRVSREFTCSSDENFRTKMANVIKTELRKDIKQSRMVAKELTQTPAIEVNGEKYYTTGGVFTTKAVFKSISGSLNNPAAEKRPISNKINYLGIELEFNAKGAGDSERAEMKRDFKEMNLGKYVCVSHDPSCGHEVKMLVPDHNYKPILKKVLDYLNGKGYTTSSNCGMHVHIDMRNRDINVAYKNLYNIQELAFLLIPKERRNNRFCKKNQYSEFKDQKANIGLDRYYFINTLSYAIHNTLEVRLHHGTLNYSLISNWLKLLVKTVNKSTVIPMQTPDNLDRFRSALSLRDYELNTIKKRIKAFA